MMWTHKISPRSPGDPLTQDTDPPFRFCSTLLCWPSLYPEIYTHIPLLTIISNTLKLNVELCLAATSTTTKSQKVLSSNPSVCNASQNFSIVQTCLSAELLWRIVYLQYLILFRQKLYILREMRIRKRKSRIYMCCTVAVVTPFWVGLIGQLIPYLPSLSCQRQQKM